MKPSQIVADVLGIVIPQDKADVLDQLIVDREPTVITNISQPSCDRGEVALLRSLASPEKFSWTLAKESGLLLSRVYRICGEEKLPFKRTRKNITVDVLEELTSWLSTGKVCALELANLLSLSPASILNIVDGKWKGTMPSMIRKKIDQYKFNLNRSQL